MSDINLARRSFLKSGAAVAATLMASAAANAGIPAAKVQKWDEEYDVVIIGSGFAGMACALKAGRAGLKVLRRRRQLRHLRRQRRLPGQPRSGRPGHQGQQGTLHR